ncbi:MAG: SPFH domain-containing protein [Lachnospiraceae bacterium]|nr:SPFH domain-containing protein [Lachnospiraceae bacterium]
MGIIKAVAASAAGMASDQWKEFFYCGSLPEDQIMVRGKRQTSAVSSNKGNPDVITDGSIISVADGQCAIIVSNGKMICRFDDPGENEFRSGETAGLFSGSKARSFGRELMRRISFGGDAPAVNQKVYYFNMKVITGNPFGRGTEVPVRVFDESRGIDIDCTLIISGVYSFRITDPEKIYIKVIGNVKHVYMVSYLAEQIRADIDSTLLTSAGTICAGTYRPYQFQSFIPEIQSRITEAANETLRESLGVEIVTLAFDSFRLKDPDTGLIKNIQLASAAADPLMAAAMLTDAQASAMRDAAGNQISPV